MNTITLLVLIIACSYSEISRRINTDCIFDKIGMLLIVLGAGLAIFRIHTHLIEVGATIYFVTSAYRECKSKHNRRKADHLPRKRKILS